MRVFLVGEASTHREDLVKALPGDVRTRVELVDLPREAAHDGSFDTRISADDVVVSLRFRRNGSALPRMRLLHVPGAGLDGIDLDRLPSETIVCNVFEHEIPIAEYTLGAMLDWEIDFRGMNASMSVESWADTYRARRPHGELFGKTVVVLGYGRIGQTVARRAQAFGMRVIGVDPFLAGKSDPSGAAEDIVHPGCLSEAASAASYLVVTCPLTPESAGAVNGSVLSALGTKGVLINVSRAEVVDEDALFEALSSEAIRGASLDVWYRYPTGAEDRVPPSNHDFLSLGNVRATPHSSAWTRELSRRRYAVIASNIAALMEGGDLRNRIERGR
jgi:phosphoglycerate dehydrogenase-like enzyme